MARVVVLEALAVEPAALDVGLVARVAQLAAAVLVAQPVATVALAGTDSTRLSGVGISLRRSHYDDILDTDRELDWIEIQPENFMGMGGWNRRLLDMCRERWPVVAHGVALSIGGPDPLSDDYLDPLFALLQQLDPPFFSEHCCYSAAQGIAFHDLLPLPFHDAAVAHVAQRTREVAARIGRPMVLENITYYAEMPGSNMAEGAFLTAVLDEADCGLLLDVNNIYVNAINLGHDPSALLASMPLERTRQIHLAGHRKEGDVLIDDHGSAVTEPVWALYREALARTGPVPTLVEWENEVPSLDRVLDEADRARTILNDLRASHGEVSRER